MKRGEVWWVDFGPAVIMSNDAANRNLSRVVVVPVTSNTERLYPGEAYIKIDGKRRKIMADQIMAADKTRLKNQLGSVTEQDMISIERAILLHLGIK